MGAALSIRDDLPPEALRRQARREANRREANRRAALRMLALANALEGMSRAEAARLAGMERQALRDAVVRYNAEGPAGLHDRPKPGRPERLSEAEQAALPGGTGVPRPRPEAGRRRGLDAGRPVRLARGALRHGVPPVQPVAGAPAAGAVAAEDPARPPRGRPGGAGALRKKIL